MTFPLGTTVALVFRALVGDSLTDGNDSVLPPTVVAVDVAAAGALVVETIEEDVPTEVGAAVEVAAEVLDAATEVDSLPGTVMVTPALLQRALATARAVCWSAAPQAPTIQVLEPLIKSGLLQAHLKSVALQLVDPRLLTRQGRAHEGKSERL